MKTIVKIIIILLLSVVILSDCALFGLLMTTDDDLFYEKQFKRQDIAEETGLDFDTLMQVNDEVQDYLNAKRADLVVYAERYGENTLIFNENEQSHMKDVRDLYSAFHDARCEVHVLDGLYDSEDGKCHKQDNPETLSRFKTLHQRQCNGGTEADEL